MKKSRETLTLSATMANICIFIGAMETNLVSLFVGLLLFRLLLLISFNLILPMLLHKSGSQDNKQFKINWLRYEV